MRWDLRRTHHCLRKHAHNMLHDKQPTIKVIHRRVPAAPGPCIPQKQMLR